MHCMMLPSIQTPPTPKSDIPMKRRITMKIIVPTRPKERAKKR